MVDSVLSSSDELPTATRSFRVRTQMALMCSKLCHLKDEI
jgi:hypothetical protein